MTKAARSKQNYNSPRVLLPLFALAVLLFAAAAYTRGLRPVDSPVAASKQIIHIKEGMGLGEIAAALSNKGYIRSPTAFTICALLSGQAGKLQSGYYELSSDMVTPHVLRVIAEGRHAVADLTVPEGLTIAQIAQLVQNTLRVDTEQFQAAATAQTIEEGLDVQLPPTVDTAEGYLFPETYQFELGANPNTIVNRMIVEFRQRFMMAVWQRTPPAQRWGSLHEVVTTASLVEEEAKVDKERALIAGVLLNRLWAGMKLQCDATVQYALPQRKSRLTHEDLRIQSPYNTYLYNGLPPGPICNPGLASLRAALRPAETQYLFYVARGDGTHIFCRTYQEHVAAIKRISAAAR